MKWILDRARERSTWIGLIAVVAGVGINIKPELSEAIVSLGVAIAGFVGVITTDK